MAGNFIGGLSREEGREARQRREKEIKEQRAVAL